MAKTNQNVFLKVIKMEKLVSKQRFQRFDIHQYNCLPGGPTLREHTERKTRGCRPGARRSCKACGWG